MIINIDDPYGQRIVNKHPQAIKDVKSAAPWSGNATINPYHTYGTPDSFGHWAGWVYAVDADSGATLVTDRIQQDVEYDFFEAIDASLPSTYDVSDFELTERSSE